MRAACWMLTMTVGGLWASMTLHAGQRPDSELEPPVAGAVTVVPFRNLNGVAVEDWIGEGIAESLVTGFPAGTAVVRRSGEIGGALGPVGPAGRDIEGRFVVGGTYQRVGDVLRITGQYFDVVTGLVLRSTKVDGAVADLFDLQDQVVSDLTGSRTGTSEMPGPQRVEVPPRGVPRGRGDAAVPAAPSEVDAPVPPERVVAAREPGRAAPEAGTVAPTSALASDGEDASYASIDGPPPPSAPDVMRRDEGGRTTVRAIRLVEGIRIDGELDESVYGSVPAITGFIQQVPDEGAPATEKTEAWIMFDDTNVYVSARVWDSAPESEWVANEMRRDTNQLRQNDTFAAFFDTFYDRRNGVNFYTNPLGARADQQFTNEGNPNADWNPVWNVRTGRFEGGWTAEMEIPFKTLRYRGQTGAQMWGVQLRRAIRRKNEWAYLTRLPISAGGGRGSAGIFMVSAAGTLVGLEPPPARRTLEIKPYVIGGFTRDAMANPLSEGTTTGDVGLDVKYGITQNLTADLTYNTDFAQVEVDEQQVNLTRFSLFFPEKREFFLESRGIFDFARGGIASGRSLGAGGFFGGGNAPTLFYSRRIGLQGGEVVPILGGGRVTGKVGQFDVGALSISTDDELVSGAEPTNFTAARVKRDILRRSSIGGIFTNRSVSRRGDGASQTYGADATFAFYDNVQMLTYYARTETPGLVGEDTSYQGQFNYAGDRYGMQVDHLLVEDNFNPEVGFVRRDNFRRTYMEGRFSPRPRSIEAVRQFRFVGGVDYILGASSNLLETRLNRLEVQPLFESSDRIDLTINDNYELLVVPFAPGPHVTIPVGGYAFTDVQVAYGIGEQRRLNGTVIAQKGGYFNGDITTLGFQRGRISVLPQMSIEPSISVNWIDTPQGAFRTDLAVTRINYAFNPRMFFSGLVQYNSASNTVSNNLRLRWEYSPGSELFVVYTEDRDSTPLRPDRRAQLRNRGFVVKFNRFFRF